MASINTDFHFNTFETQWAQLSKKDRALVVKNAAKLEPELAILPILTGITSQHFAVRNNAKKGLESIQNKINNSLSSIDDDKQHLKDTKTLYSICARIYTQISKEMPFPELEFFFKALLKFKEQGAYFAFQAVYSKLVSVKAMEKIIYNVPESSRLSFVFQYLQAPPDIRLKFGFTFKKILQSIKKRESVIKFYADLFDTKKDADPFLNNISLDLRDPNLIITNEIKSLSLEKQILGLKVLSMIESKISSDLLIKSLTNQKIENQKIENQKIKDQKIKTPIIKKLRVVIYNIIENSSLGVYPELFDPVLKIFYKCDKQEAFQAFKALIVTGKQPLYKLLDIVRDDYPTLMPLINTEISKLSKISFFFIQDIALNKEKYLNSNFKINLACLFCMIKKRPERVVTILKQYDNDSNKSNNAQRMDVAQLVEKTENLIVREKQDIETQFDLIVQKVKKESKKPKGLIKTLFLNASKKKIKNLKAQKNLELADFNKEIIKDIDLSSSEFIASSLFFNQCIFNNCDFSNSWFVHAFFKAAVFYNIDMQKTKFENVNFDNAFFINVNAKGAIFKNCSFQNISVFNCNFNHAQIINGSFVNSTISKTSFNQARIFCSSFAHSKLSAISFVTSDVNHVDFTNVKARFCRFPPITKLNLQNSEIDYNARKFQLSLNDISQMDQTIFPKINMLIISEFIHYGEMKFLNQNQLSLLVALDIFQPAQADLFQIVPFLIHENIAFPGFKDIPEQTPHGICDFVPSIETQKILKKYINQEKTVAMPCQNHAVEGLFTIGSTGSIAQTEDSDIDWWVCINEKNFTSKGIKLFRQKLDLLEKIAKQQFNTQMTFFLVDILKAKNNDFGDSTIESSGSAHARLLKEEFYRTMIYIAGKIPLWSVLPTSISINYYNSIVKTVASFPNLTRYIDLGDIHAISTSEYIGASIWQMFKWLKSPFKSVIKMALLEKFIYEYGKQSLLCNQYKDEWMNSGAHLNLAQNDSYYILLKNLLLYYETNNDKQSVNLLLTCFFLKLGISKDSQLDNTVFGLKKILLEKCMVKWEWNKRKVFEIGNFKTWNYSNIVKLSNFIGTYMIKRYKIVNKAFKSLLHERSGISLEDQTVLGRKVLVEFSKRSGKVGKVLLVSRNDSHFQSLQLKYIKKDNTSTDTNKTNTNNTNNKGTSSSNTNIGFWQLFNKNIKIMSNQEEVLIEADTIEEIGAWLINNSLYNKNTIINLIPNPSYVAFDDIRKLYKNMYDFFNPIVNISISLNQLLMKNRVVCMFVSINFYSPKQGHKISDYCALYLNSWGEMFCKSFYSEQGIPSMVEAKKDIMNKIGIKNLPLNTVFYFAKGAARGGSQPD